MSSPIKASRAGVTNPFLWPPQYETFYTIGARVHKRLPKFCTCKELSQALGVSRQKAYNDMLVALGKFVYYLVKQVGEVPEL